jgi:hypothetical protein
MKWENKLKNIFHIKCMLILDFLMEKIEKLKATKVLNLHYQVMCPLGAILPPSLSLEGFGLMRPGTQRYTLWAHSLVHDILK